MRVDVHAHLFPAVYLDLLDEMRGDGGDGTREVRELGGGDSERELGLRLAAMDAVGVDVQLLSTCPQGPYTGDPTAAVEAARCANLALAHTAAQHPDRFRALATLPLPHILASVDELNRAMEQDGMPGAAVGTSILGRPLSHPDFEPVFAALNRRNAVLFVHPNGDSAGSSLMRAAKLDWVIGHAAEVSTAILQLFQAGLTVKYPGIRVIAPHMGGYLPFLIQRLDRHRDWYLPDDAPSAGQLMRGIAYDTANPLPAALRLTAEVVGPDRLLLGTDYPFEQGPSLRDHVEYLFAAGLADEQAKAIVDMNAAAFLGMNHT
ncbi:amidohydrolase [Catenulispora sp. NF23]|uniref:Amidohydrolase n=1 Tax=Catenulispora pinistramenti TaxID=2705254 RepID=A0ABS5KHL7_9ACTN|nr:amidohydrolase family protein [Catenulispora pinistramenti]MBS2537975.1 amidohydrolase [Catenulispora pinistramenti]MBS2545542.1 amidohydrolase [Catenulispora pinistramenti]